jgi:xanthine/CO dehydrogenase XdhC/CoxF family maturation factor
MAELIKMLALWKAARRDGDDLCLVTVVRTEGSSYRKSGARMLLSHAGRRAGTISGGCLEAEVQKKAWWLTRSGPTVERYSSFFDDDSDIPYGLGCGGTVWVLLERGAVVDSVLGAIERGAEANSPVGIGAVIADHASLTPGTRVILDRNGACLWSEAAPAELASLTQSALRQATSLWQHEPASLFAEFVSPPQRLFLFGAGDDAQPVAALAAELGWQVTVLDGRAHLATGQRFPSARAVRVFGAETAAELGALGIHARDAVVLMTHSYAQDRTVLRHLQDVPAGYVGVLGPPRRTQQLLQDAGVDTQETLCKLHSPAGLNIGANGPVEIALSIVAEIQAVMNRGSAENIADTTARKALSSG